jgi:hypothetical protein
MEPTIAGRAMTWPVSSAQQFLGRWLFDSEKPLRKSGFTEEQLMA